MQARESGRRTANAVMIRMPESGNKFSGVGNLDLPRLRVRLQFLVTHQIKIDGPLDTRNHSESGSAACSASASP